MNTCRTCRFLRWESCQAIDTYAGGEEQIATVDSPYDEIPASLHIRQPDRFGCTLHEVRPPPPEPIDMTELTKII